MYDMTMTGGEAQKAADKTRQERLAWDFNREEEDDVEDFGRAAGRRVMQAKQLSCRHTIMSLSSLLRHA